jgi:hypothetical protein
MLFSVLVGRQILMTLFPVSSVAQDFVLCLRVLNVPKKETLTKLNFATLVFFCISGRTVSNDLISCLFCRSGLCVVATSLQRP